MARTLILGAGFGGITVATGLRQALPDEHEIVLVDSRESFSMGLRKLWEIVGIGTIAEGSRAREALNERGIRFVRAEITAIDPARRAATIGNEELDADHLVVALGAEPRSDLVAGLDEHGHNPWDRANVARLRDEVERFEEGRLAIVVAGAPYACPPAPYELAMLLDEMLRGRGNREQVELVVSTLQPLLMPNAGEQGSAFIGEQLDERGISYAVKQEVERIEAGRVVYADGELEFDLLVGVPPHRVPAVVADSGLTGDGDWIAVDQSTLETEHEGVFAIGDVNQIKLANGLPLPMAGVIAEAEGERVAAAIAAELQETTPPEPFDGHGYCFLEMGSKDAALVEGDFFADPEPQVVVGKPASAAATDKRRFESERFERWFGG